MTPSSSNPEIRKLQEIGKCCICDKESTDTHKIGIATGTNSKAPGWLPICETCYLHPTKFDNWKSKHNHSYNI